MEVYNPNLPPEEIEDIIMGCGNPEGAQGHNIARNAAVLSKLPISTGGTTLDFEVLPLPVPRGVQLLVTMMRN